MAFFIMAMLALGLLLDAIHGPWKPLAITAHITIGICILALAVFRILWRIRKKNNFRDNFPLWQVIAADMSHLMLYALMLAMPLSGWIMVSALGKQASLFGLVTLPAIADRNPDFGIWMKGLHGQIAYALIGIIAIHMLAALYHHVIKKDDVLKRMLPRCMKA